MNQNQTTAKLSTEEKPVPLMNQEIRYYPAEHEVFLSFLGDDEAATFGDWWFKRGLPLWQAYHAKHKKEYR